MSKKENAVHAFRILNFMVGDVVTATRTRELFHTDSFAELVGEQVIVCANRMCLSHLFLTLDKWAEFYNRFHKVIPDDCRSECKSLLKEIRRRKVKEFRDKVVAHIWDKHRRRPLTEAEIEELAQSVMGNDVNAFSAWCNNPNDNEFPKTVLSIIERTRDRIREDFKIEADDL